MSSKETVNEASGAKLGRETRAVLAKTVVADGFGPVGLCIPAVLIIFSLRIMRFRPAMLRKSVRLTLILMILGSLTLGFLFRGNGKCSAPDWADGTAFRSPNGWYR